MGEPDAAWHQALVFALTGTRRPALGRQPVADLGAVTAAVGPGPHGAYVVPPDLLVGIGPARFAAVLTELRGLLRAARSGPVVAERAPDGDERRLLGDVPPHY